MENEQCKRLHAVAQDRKITWYIIIQHLILATLHHHTMHLYTPHTAFLHAMHMFIQLNHRTFHRLTAVRRFVDGRWQIALRPSTNRFTTVKYYTTSRQNKRNTKLLLKKCHACMNQATYFQDMNNVSAQY